MAETIQQIIDDACSLVTAGVQSNDNVRNLRVLNRMLDNWSVDGLTFSVAIEESFPLVAGTVSYTVGSGGNFNTVRPTKITSAFIHDNESGEDEPLDVSLTNEAYDSIDLKTTPGKPFELFYNPSYPLGTVYLYYAPDKVYNLVINSVKPFVDVTDTSQSFSLPPGWGRAIQYNLALELAPLYKSAVGQEVARVANESYRRMKSVSTRPAQPQFKGVPGMCGWPK